MLSRVEHEKSFITLGPGLHIMGRIKINFLISIVKLAMCDSKEPAQ